MGYPVPLTTEDWARVRYEYECTNLKVVEICAEHGISAGTLRDRVRRWGWTRRWSGPVPREGPPPMAVPMIAFQAPVMEVRPLEMAQPPHPNPLPLSSPNGERSLAYGEREQTDVGAGRSQYNSEPSPHIVEDGRERSFVVEDGRERPFVVEDGRERPFVHDARPIGQRLQGAIAQAMPALETTLASLAAGPMQPRQMEQAARALGSLTRTLRELHGLVAQHGAQRCDDDAGDDTCEDVEELRANLNRQIDALIEEERQERPRRYLAGWEEFAAEAAHPYAAVTRTFSPRPAASSARTIAKRRSRSTAACRSRA